MPDVSDNVPQPLSSPISKRKHASYKKMLHQIIAAGSSGFLEICLMHPLNLVKTRFQLQGRQASVHDPIYYKSLTHCVTTIYRTEGFLSFYKGILPPILAETPKWAVRFFFFERYQELFGGSGETTPMVYALAGLCSGITEAIVVNPFERVNIQLQSEKYIKLKDQDSAFSKARQIIKADGFGMMGLNRGLTATLGRHGVWSTIYFGLYHSLKENLPPAETRSEQVTYKLLLGYTAGTLGAIANMPYDVAKSRIQGPQPVPGQIKYYGAHQTIVTIYKEEGFRALFKGLLPKLLRFGPSGAIMMFCYETLCGYLDRRFP